MSTNSVTNSVSPSLRSGNNGGTLRTGNPGNKGGGRRPDHIRAAARESLDLALDVLDERLRDRESLSTHDLLKALDLLLRYGIGPALKESCLERPDASRCGEP